MSDTPAQVTRFRGIGVFCGSRTGTRPRYMDVAAEFGAALVGRGVGLVYGAGGVGVMGALAKGAVDAGARVTGVIPHELFEREQPDHTGTELFVVRSMHQRKALMYRLASAFAVLPGGFGTLDELMEVATWNQLSLHEKPVVLLNVDGFFDPLTALLDHLQAEGFITASERALVQVAHDCEQALDLLAQARRVPVATGWEGHS
ncbi:TIGR00730 family Rossman fold protein [Streptomyces sp. CdTB01]|uniref:LOG family protein n=1 Tax=Streptomyces sp. CdTB01 TaxID=1725411 RepID=UPI000AA51D98|nr:TIGR00730 family Rossman fold protein [Streptomyces sp. CdTB01]